MSDKNKLIEAYANHFHVFNIYFNLIKYNNQNIIKN